MDTLLGLSGARRFIVCFLSMTALDPFVVSLLSDANANAGVALLRLPGEPTCDLPAGIPHPPPAKAATPPRACAALASGVAATSAELCEACCAAMLLTVRLFGCFRASNQCPAPSHHGPGNPRMAAASWCLSGSNPHYRVVGPRTQVFGRCGPWRPLRYSMMSARIFPVVVYVTRRNVFVTAGIAAILQLGVQAHSRGLAPRCTAGGPRPRFRWPSPNCHTSPIRFDDLISGCLPCLPALVREVNLFTARSQLFTAPC